MVFYFYIGVSLSPSQQKLGFGSEPPKVEKKETPEDVGEWLNSQDLIQYEATFLAHGYDNTHFIVSKIPQSLVALRLCLFAIRTASFSSH